jgi:hypothetical protein
MRNRLAFVTVTVFAIFAFTTNVLAQMGCIHCVQTQTGYRCQSGGGDHSEGWCYCDTTAGYCEVDFPCWIDQNGRNCFFPELTKNLKRPRIDAQTIKGVAATSPRLAMALAVLNRHPELPINHTRIFIASNDVTADLVDKVINPSNPSWSDFVYAVGDKKESAYDVALERTGPFTAELKVTPVTGLTMDIPRELDIDLVGNDSLVVAQRVEAAWRFLEVPAMRTIANSELGASSWNTLKTSD